MAVSPILTFGMMGKDSGHYFLHPEGIAYANWNNQIVVADRDNHRIQFFSAEDGGHVKSLGLRGMNAAEFESPRGVGVIPSRKEIVVSDTGNNRIQIFDQEGQFVREIDGYDTVNGNLRGPIGVTADPEGLIYVCDSGGHKIRVFNDNGQEVRAFGSAGEEIGEFNSPHGIAISEHGFVYVCDYENHRVQVFQPHGKCLFTFGCLGNGIGEFNVPAGVAISKHGSVIVTDQGNNRIQIFRPNYTYRSFDGDTVHIKHQYLFFGLSFFTDFGELGVAQGQFNNIGGVAILGNGNIVISDTGNHRIQLFNFKY